jgi:2-hydroxychromene-2-carboxylate isomerase
VLSLTQVDFYFYLGCPWTWLAFVRLRETAMRTGAGIVWKPVMVDRVTEASNPAAPGARAAISPAKLRYHVKDLQDWARFCGVTIATPGPFGAKAGYAVRGAIAAIAAGRAVPYCERVFRARFERGADLDDPDTVAALAVAAGPDERGFRDAVADPASQRAVEALCEELVARGGFGSPTIFVGDDMYFGNDRMPLVELALNLAADQPLVAPGAHSQT